MSASTELLSESEVGNYLAKWPNWQVEGSSIRRVVRAENHLSAVAFIHAAIEMSTEHQHYPDVHLSNKNLTLTLSTTTDGVTGISPLDFLVAECIDQIPVDTLPDPIHDDSFF